MGWLSKRWLCSGGLLVRGWCSRVRWRLSGRRRVRLECAPPTRWGKKTRRHQTSPLIAASPALRRRRPPTPEARRRRRSTTPSWRHVTRWSRDRFSSCLGEVSDDGEWQFPWRRWRQAKRRRAVTRSACCNDCHAAGDGGSTTCSVDWVDCVL